MSMEKQGIIGEGITPPENEDPQRMQPADSPDDVIEKLADDHTISRMIQRMSKHIKSPCVPKDKC